MRGSGVEDTLRHVSDAVGLVVAVRYRLDPLSGPGDTMRIPIAYIAAKVPRTAHSFTTTESARALVSVRAAVAKKSVTKPTLPSISAVEACSTRGKGR